MVGVMKLRRVVAPFARRCVARRLPAHGVRIRPGALGPAGHGLVIDDALVVVEIRVPHPQALGVLLLRELLVDVHRRRAPAHIELLLVHHAQPEARERHREGDDARAGLEPLRDARNVPQQRLLEARRVGEDEVPVGPVELARRDVAVVEPDDRRPREQRLHAVHVRLGHGARRRMQPRQDLDAHEDVAVHGEHRLEDGAARAAAEVVELAEPRHARRGRQQHLVERRKAHFAVDEGPRVHAVFLHGVHVLGRQLVRQRQVRLLEEPVVGRLRLLLDAASQQCHGRLPLLARAR
mmetsp:Transcript_31598/g.100309  ORF Transcript_31598/g.100309 Transcript_31598/m.100309 type:complete len:294 (-) Transcript_31598:227-1108(-)